MDVIEISKMLAAKVLAVMGQLHLEDDAPRGKSQWGCHRPVQIPSLGDIYRGVTQNTNRQDSALSAAPGRSGGSVL